MKNNRHKIRRLSSCIPYVGAIVVACKDTVGSAMCRHSARDRIVQHDSEAVIQVIHQGRLDVMLTAAATGRYYKDPWPLGVEKVMVLELCYEPDMISQHENTKS